VASYLKDHLVPNLIGRDAGRIEDIWQFFYRGAYWRRGPVTMTAISAVDVALWDILGKMSGLPMYRLLGGRSREGALVYGHANGKDIHECSAEVGKYIAQGYKAIRAQCGVPGVNKAYGVSNLKNAYEPAESELPAETVWSTPKYLDIVPKLFERLRKDHGSDVELLHDVHHRLTPIEAARLGNSLEPYRLFWLEDATPAENQRSFEVIRKHTVTPLAVGEVFNSIWDCKYLIENQLIDYIRTTIVHGGGITHVRRLADFAALHGVRTGFHGATDLSPVCMGAALHFDTWVPNFGIQEYMRHAPETDEVFPHDYSFRDGRLHCGESPGHGVTIDQKLAAKYPYNPKQLPVARLEDGTMWDW
jgi:mannonate dehydratase